MDGKLRRFIFHPEPQPSEKPVFDQDITGGVMRRQEPGLNKEAGQISSPQGAGQVGRRDL
jgi:hypothetical protein